jgi:CrcB protein
MEGIHFTRKNKKLMLKTIFIVGAGGFLGSVARYLTQIVAERYLHSSFPWGTLAANIAGCFIIGLVYALSERGNLLSPEWRIFMTVGFCGGFTTFSAFAYNNLTMLSENNFAQLIGNVGLNLFFGIAAVYLGIIAIRFIYG